MAKQAEAKSNVLKPEEIQKLVGNIEAEQEKIDKISVEARKKAQPHRDAINGLKDQLAEGGVPKKGLAAAIRKRRLQKKAAEVEEKLSEEVRDDFAMVWDSLGGDKGLGSTPLGGFAGAKAPNGTEARA